MKLFFFSSFSLLRKSGKGNNCIFILTLINLFVDEITPSVAGALSSFFEDGACPPCPTESCSGKHPADFPV